MTEPRDLIIEPLKRIQDRLSQVERGLHTFATAPRGLERREIANLSSEVCQDAQLADLAAHVERRIDLVEG